MSNDRINIQDPATAVLIVDDNPQYSSVLKRILEQVFNYKDITSVDSLSKAESLLQDGNTAKVFGILFIDFRFPSEENGAQFIERMAALGRLARKAVFLITSEPNIENFKRAVGSGAAGVIGKPFDREDLRRQLQNAQRMLDVDSVESF